MTTYTAAAYKAWDTRRANELHARRRAAALKAWETIRRNERREIALRAWDTRDAADNLDAV